MAAILNPHPGLATFQKHAPRSFVIVLFSSPSTPSGSVGSCRDLPNRLEPSLEHPGIHWMPTSDLRHCAFEKL